MEDTILTILGTVILLFGIMGLNKRIEDLNIWRCLILPILGVALIVIGASL